MDVSEEKRDRKHSLDFILSSEYSWDYSISDLSPMTPNGSLASSPKMLFDEEDELIEENKELCKDLCIKKEIKMKEMEVKCFQKERTRPFLSRQSKSKDKKISK